MVKAEGDKSVLGIYFKEIAKIPLLTVEEEREMGKRKDKGDEKALNKLVNSNLRYVISTAKRYLGGCLSLSDLISEGNIGLIEAAKRYDFRKGYRFLTYANFWIERYIKNSFIKEADPRIPNYKLSSLIKIKKAISNFGKDKDMFLGITELAEKFNLSINEINDSLSMLKDTVSLEDKIERQPEFEKILEDKRYNPRKLVEEKMFKKDLSFFIENILSNKEAEVIKYRFGLGEKELLTLEKVGDKFGCSRERVRQIQKRALKKLRASGRLKQYF